MVGGFLLPALVSATPVEVLDRIERRVLWLSVAMIDHANRVRENPSGLKVGGHQASSASMVSIMTALWFQQLTAADRVSVKPHAAPVLHAINYLLGRLDESSLTTLRAFGGLQSYPSRSKDPDPVDYSTGSVGLGATAPVWGAVARRYVGQHFGAGGSGRQYALIGDAELDEGACWEALLDPAVPELGELVWIVDVNRQSLDRVVPHLAASRVAAMFEAAGWQVITVKYGALLESLFTRPGGAALRARLDAMSNPEYQRLLRLPVAGLRERLPGSGPGADAIGTLLDGVDDHALPAALRNLGGHDHRALREAFAAIEDTRPTVIFAYTVKGHGLPTEGHPHNHSSLLSAEQLESVAARLGVDLTDRWAGFDPGSDEGLLCARTAQRLARPPVPAPAPVTVPADFGRTPTRVASTQSALGRTLLDLLRAAPEVGARVVTVSPDVSSTTNLGGWVTKVGTWSVTERPNWFADDPDTILQWREGPGGQHIELGIAETNLVGVLGELGATGSRWGQPLLPIGVLYDPFVARALEPWSFGIYAGGRSLLVGTPSGVSLAAEGGAHQSIITPSIGLEQPGCVSYEPAFVLDTEWTLLGCLAQLTRPEGRSAYVRLSTRPVDQRLAAVPSDPAARERRRTHVLAGGYVLRRPVGAVVTIAAMGAMVPEAVAAATRLHELGIEAEIVCVTSPGLLFAAVQARRGRGHGPHWILDTLFGAASGRPLVTVLDGHPHTLAFLGTVHGVPAIHLGVTEFGQSGDLDAVYRHHGIDTDAIVRAGLDLVPAP
ncbi:transketolase-like TK C-terminal-containing protein [Nocardia vaccinii]|uniref:transketolase-like TK C-terminal-containing protein n=1 Tax=Nocardia vaccinii TaxID=1822 RepID=UPI0008322767|nr:1-deoxy-D-xylulose-5-phosphate synthase N-terminal domain-containing protein [Nocardia vaccinii]